MKGLSFIPEMARAALAGTKTQTRRIMNPQPHREFLKRGLVGAVPQWPVQDGIRFFMADGMSELVKSDYRPGERRCLLTTWAVDAGMDHLLPTELDPDHIEIHGGLWHAGMTPRKPLANVPPLGKSRPGRFFPNHLRHLMPVLEIVSVRAERVQSITEADAKAEGAPEPTGRRGCYPAPWATAKAGPCDYRESFQKLWDSINAKRGPGEAKTGYGWSFNPWVFRVEFRRVTT